MIGENRRIYGKVREIPVEVIKEVFASLPGIEAAVLFGSRAERADGSSPHGRDYDFAVLMNKNAPCDWGHLAKARVDIGRALRLPDVDFDVVDLEIASRNLRDSIKAGFILLKGNEDDLRRLLE